MFCIIRRYFLKIPSYYNTEAFLLQAGLSDFSIGEVKIRYCLHGYVPRGVFVRFLRENPELHGAFYAVSVHREACYSSQHIAFWRSVNCN